MSELRPGRGPAGAGAAAHAFVADLDTPVLEPDDHHHLTRVLRLRVGDRVTVADGRGRWRPALVTAAAELEPVGPVEIDVAPEPAVTIAFALVKGERPEHVVQKLTEVGVDRIVPFAAERSVVRWDAERAERNVARLRRVAREAAMQCRRAWLPVVDAPVAFATAAALPGAALADVGGSVPDLDHPVLLAGPEGGWSPAERAVGLPTIELGPHVLRADTAAVVAGTLLVAIRSQLVRPNGQDHRA
jgi:16S rRNA (uracil1498-N3)-methyltransferase